MKRRIISILLLCALMMGCVCPAQAEDCFTIDVDVLDMDRLNSDDYVARALSASTQGVRVRKYISQSSELAAPVRLTLTQMDSGLLMFDKDYGFQSGTFDSGVIYLPYVDDRTIPYLVTLYVGDYVYAMPFMHLQPRLRGNSACTYGLRLRDLGVSTGGDWMMGTMVDLSSLGDGGSQRVDVCASGSKVIGYADIGYSGGAVRVDLAFNGSAGVEVSQYALYVITDFAAFAGGYTGPSYQPGEWIDAGGADAVMIYLPMQVSYNPAGLPEYSYHEDSRQRSLWERGSGSAGASEPSVSTDSWNAGGWEDGWSSNGWDDGWSGSGSGWMDAPGDGW